MDSERSSEGINVLRKESLGPTGLVLESGSHFFSDLPDKGGLYGEVPKDIKLKVIFFGKLNEEVGFTKCQILRIRKFRGETEITDNFGKLNLGGEGKKFWSVDTLNWVYCPNEELKERIAEKKKKEDEAQKAAEKIWEETRKRDLQDAIDLKKAEEKGKFRVPRVEIKKKFNEGEYAIKRGKSEFFQKKEWLPYKDEYQPMPKKRRKR